MLSHLFSILIHFPSWHVKSVDGQALSCSWTLMGASFTISEENVIFIDTCWFDQGCMCCFPRAKSEDPQEESPCPPWSR